MSDRSWADSGAHEVQPGIWRIPLPLPNDHLHAVNVYAVRDGDEVVLIDGGWAVPGVYEALIDGLAQIECSVNDVREVLVTHVHRDHFTQAIDLRRRHGIPVALGVGERPSVERLIEGVRTGHRPWPALEQLGRAGASEILAEASAAFHSERLDAAYEQPDRWIEDRAEIEFATRRLTAFATPGHTRGHVVFRDAAASLLFTGDHVLPHITPSIGLEPRRDALPLGDYLESLAAVRSLPDSMLLPAHGPVADSVHRRIDELLDHHEARFAAVMAAADTGAGTAYEVARLLTWTGRRRSFADLDIFNKTLASIETLAHLDVLVARGWLVSTNESDGVRWFGRSH